MDIVMEYVDKYPSFKIINNEVNKGLGESRNIGISHATSDYLTFIDSDDFISLNTFKDALDKDVDLVIIGSKMNPLFKQEIEKDMIKIY